MDNKDFPEINEIVESIKNSLKTELEAIKTELKDNLKTELDNIKTELKDEIDNIRSGEIPPPRPHIPPIHFRPFEDTPEPESFRMESNKNTEEFKFTDFTGIHVGGAFEVEVTRSDSFGISITAEDALFRNLHVSKEGEILRIRHSRHISWRAQLTRPRAVITMPIIKELRLSGATTAVLSGFDSSEDFKMELSGASKVSGDITAGNADFELSGASQARLSGSSGDVIIKATGANHIDLRDFTVNNAAVKLSGASHVKANVTGRLDARLSGVSHFSWTGNPIMGDIRTSGASSLSRE